ncbi:MAG: hypothetical protein ACT443_01965 [Gemmatimonadota bacterium]
MNLTVSDIGSISIRVKDATGVQTGHEVFFKSSDESVVTVQDNGEVDANGFRTASVKAVGGGNATVSATVEGAGEVTTNIYARGGGKLAVGKGGTGSGAIAVFDLIPTNPPIVSFAHIEDANTGAMLSPSNVSGEVRVIFDIQNPPTSGTVDLRLLFNGQPA